MVMWESGQITEISQQELSGFFNSIVVLYQLAWMKTVCPVYLSYNANMFQGKCPLISVLSFP